LESSGNIVVTGAAGLVGQNLIPRLKTKNPGKVVGIDKHPANTEVLARLHPDIRVVEANLAKRGAWEDSFANIDTLVLNHAQISALDQALFIENNITATKNVLDAAKKGGVRQIVHISSSVVNSKASDFYVDTKKAQEALVTESGVPACILRPTLMFGWFDRKHLGWLARFMQRTPLFPIPGDGRFLRQPLYAGDFCSVIISCIDKPRAGEYYNISGLEKIDYIDLITAVKVATKASAALVRIPYRAFWLLLRVYAVFDRNPPFTTDQLEALVIPEVFEIIDWPTIFGIRATPLAEALRQTFQDPKYSSVVLDF
jgi:nucleoside-diphosphate-sugar epimerase